MPFQNGRFLFKRERVDKSHANANSTAIAIMKSLEDPVTEEYLIEYIKTNGYKEVKRTYYRQPGPLPEMKINQGIKNLRL